MRWIYIAPDFIGTDEGDDSQTVAYLDNHRNKRAWTKEEKGYHGRLIARAPEMLNLLHNILTLYVNGIDLENHMDSVADLIVDIETSEDVKLYNLKKSGVR